MSRVVLKAVFGEDLCCSMACHPVGNSGEEGSCNTPGCVVSLVWFLCFSYKPLITLNHFKLPVVLLGHAFRKMRPLAKYSVWMIIGKESSLASKQLFCVPHLPFGGTKGKCLVQVMFLIYQA